MKTPQFHVRAPTGAGRSPTDPRRKHIIFRAVPDNTYIRMKPDGRGSVLPVWPNCIVLPDDIFGSLIQRSLIAWYPPGNGMALNDADCIINTAADADEYAAALGWLASLNAAKTVSIFNHPVSVLNTRRDRISEVLQGIDGLVVPKCVQFTPASPEDFIDVFNAEGMRYPVLVRPAGSQTGKGLVKIDGPDSWAEINKIPWGGSRMFMTQYVDFAGENKRYTKIRISCVGKKHVIRHVKFADEWLVHNTSTANQMVVDEMRVIDEVSASDPLAETIRALMSRVRLDFWGIDIGYRGPGKPLVFFEANAAMSMLHRSMNEEPRAKPATPEAVRKADIEVRLHQMVVNHLEAPHEWIAGHEQLIFSV